jgi:tetratricopeptide (TPR) repeat protein
VASISGEGKWKKTSVEEFANNIISASSLLSGTCANYYAKNYPIEQNGRNPLLYNSGLIMLPASYSEKPQFARAVLSLCSFASENKLSHKKLYTLATNLARFPDPTIACTGYAVASALIHERKPEDQKELLLLADKFRDIAPEIAEAMLLARENLDVGEDWPILIERGQTDEAAKIFYNLAALGYLPFLRLKLSTLFNPEVQPILKPLQDSNPQKIVEVIDELNSLGFGSDDLLLLKPFVKLWSGQIDLAEEDLKGIDEHYLEENSFVRSCFFEIKGRLFHLDGNIDEAISYINKSLSLQSEDHSLSHLSELHSALSVLLREKGEIQQSIVHLQESLNIRQNSFRARTSLLRFQINLAIESGNDNLFNQQEVELLYRSCPADLQVFALAQISSLLESSSTREANKD